MKLLYISYWGIKDALTVSTVLPNVKILSNYFSEIHLATMERFGKATEKLPSKVSHFPFYTYTMLPRVFGKALDWVHFCIKLYALERKVKFDYVICRGSMAAVFGIFLNRTLNLPFIVESFEPHADYMVEGNTWSKLGIEYNLQKWIESKSIKYAQYLMPVSNNYANFLRAINVSEDRILVMPCCVDLNKFQLNLLSRKNIRNKLNLSDGTLVGIYVGKFGDIYLKEEAFEIFRKSKDYFGDNFFLIILTPHNSMEVKKYLSSVNYDNSKVFVTSVTHDLVPSFLSAADFAFSLIRTSPSRKYCSPIKNGEYWASGLPILMTKGIGDDENIIRKSKTGFIIDLEKGIEPQLACMKSLLNDDRATLSKKIATLASEHRNFQIIAKGYAKVFGNRLHVN